MQRSLILFGAVLVSGCSFHHARLQSTSTVSLARPSDDLCGPIGIRRASLGARWGEYVRVSVTSPNAVSGEARLHVDGRASPLQRFDTSSAASPIVQLATSTELPAVVPAVTQQQVVVLDMGWTNERLDVPAAIEAGHVIDVTISGVRTESGSCAGVVFTVEQGVFQPNVDERAWVAELTRRGGPELQAWFAAEAARKEQVRQEHYALAEQRRVEWAVQLEARREAARVEAAAAVELARTQEAQRVERARAEAVRREEIRQAHYAEWERRKLEVHVQAVAVAGAPAVERVTPAPVVAREAVSASHESSVHVTATAISTSGMIGGVGSEIGSAGGTLAGGVGSTAGGVGSTAGGVATGAVTETGSAGGTVSGTVGTEISATVTEIGSAGTVGTEISSTAGGVASGAVTETGSAGGTATSSVGTDSNSTSGGSVTGSIGSGEAISSTGEISFGGQVGLQARPVSREDVVAQSSPQEWSTPTFSRVTVTTEQVTPCAPPPPPAPVVQVVEHRVDPGAAVAVHVLGALFGMFAHAPPPVHAARPAQQPSSSVPSPRPPPPTVH